jgi:hypothetical protein
MRDVDELCNGEGTVVACAVGTDDHPSELGPVRRNVGALAPDNPGRRGYGQ